MNPAQTLAVKGVLFCLCTLVLIIANIMVSLTIRWERDRQSYFWMAVAFLACLGAIYLAQNFV